MELSTIFLWNLKYESICHWPDIRTISSGILVNLGSKNHLESIESMRCLKSVRDNNKITPKLKCSRRIIFSRKTTRLIIFKLEAFTREI